MKNTFKLLGVITLTAVLIFALASCSSGGGDDDPTLLRVMLPWNIQYTMWQHDTGIKLEFKEDSVIVTPSGGGATTYIYKNSSTELGKTVLHFKTSGDQAAFVVAGAYGNWVESASFPEIGIKSNGWSVFNPVIDGIEFELISDYSQNQKYYSLIRYIGDTETLVTMVIPSNVNGLPVKQIYVDNFQNYTNLTTINVDAENSSFTSQDGVLYNKNKTLLIRYPPGKTGAFTIPDSVTSIEVSAFQNSGLTSVDIPSGVTSIGYMAFYGCSGLTSVTIGNSVTSIGDSAFALCISLTSVTIPNSVISIGDRAFMYCTSFTSITIPNSVTSIGVNAFAFCTSLTSVTFQGTITAENLSSDAILIEGDLRDKYLAEGIGTYTREDNGEVWTKQP